MKPIRAALFAPGTKERVMTKALESDADAVIFDLEDSVPIAAKAEARELVAKTIEQAHASGAGPLSRSASTRARPGFSRTISSPFCGPGSVRSFCPRRKRPKKSRKPPRCSNGSNRRTT